MFRRRKVKKSKSKRMFRNSSNRTHRKNTGRSPVMRGGIRL